MEPINFFYVFPLLGLLGNHGANVPKFDVGAILQA